MRSEMKNFFSGIFDDKLMLSFFIKQLMTKCNNYTKCILDKYC
jgi:hypothetical protein